MTPTIDPIRERPNTMNHRIQGWKSLPSAHKDYAVVYALGVLWATVYLVFTPEATENFFDRILVILWVTPAAIGAVIGVFGIFTRDSLLLERLGVTLFMIAPAVFTVIQLSLTYVSIIDGIDSTDPSNRMYLIVAGALIFTLLNRRRRYLVALVRQAKRVPLPSELER